jgi:hypothetical protein
VSTIGSFLCKPKLETKEMNKKLCFCGGTADELGNVFATFNGDALSEDN